MQITSVDGLDGLGIFDAEQLRRHTFRHTLSLELIPVAPSRITSPCRIIFES